MVELHSFYSEDKEYEAIVTKESDGIKGIVYVVRTYHQREIKDVRSFGNESMAEYWADDCIIDYDLKSVADRSKE